MTSKTFTRDSCYDRDAKNMELEDVNKQSKEQEELKIDDDDDDDNLNQNAQNVTQVDPLLDNDEKEEESRLTNGRQSHDDLGMLSDVPIPPDGGWGWMIVLASFFIHVVADGVVYSFGVFLPEFIDQFGGGRADTSLLGSLLPGITLLTGPVSSVLTNKYGCRAVTISGAFVASLGFVISIFAPNMIFLYFSFGIISGFGLGLIYLPAIVSVGFYFEKKRAFATGMAVCGSGFGTFVFAPFSRYLIDEYSWKGAVLIQAGLLLNCAVCGALMRPLESPRDKYEKLLRHRKEKQDRDIEAKNNRKESDQQQPFLKKKGYKKCLKSPSITVTSSHGSVNMLQEARFTEEDLTKVVKKDAAKARSADLSLRPARSQLGIVSSHSQHSLHGPLSRKDIFYSASLVNIPMYTSNHSLYVTSVTSIPGILRDDTDTASSAVCPSLPPEVREMLDFSLLKDKVFLLFVISNFFTSVGFNTPFIFFPDRAMQEGIKKYEASFLLSIIGIANTIGRVVFGYIADLKCVNRLYLYNSALTVCGLATALNALCTTYPLLAIDAAVFGLLIGAYVTMTSPILVDLLGLDKLTNSFGLLLLFQGLATLMGPPIAGGVFDETQSYGASFGIVGSMIAVSGIMLFFIPCVQRHVQKKKGMSQMDVDLGKKI